MCDERDSQLSNGWLRKVGVPGFLLLVVLWVSGKDLRLATESVGLINYMGNHKLFGFKEYTVLLFYRKSNVLPKILFAYCNYEQSQNL